MLKKSDLNLNISIQIASPGRRLPPCEYPLPRFKMSFTDLEIPRRLLWKRLTDEGTEGPSTWAEYEVDGPQKNDAGGDWDGSG